MGYYHPSASNRVCTVTDHSQNELVSRILEDSALDEQALSATLGQLLTRRVDYADLYFQLGESERWTLEDGIVRDAGFSRTRGVGVRAVGGDKTGFAYADDLDRAALMGRIGAGIAREDSELLTWPVIRRIFAQPVTPGTVAGRRGPPVRERWAVGGRGVG